MNIFENKEVKHWACRGIKWRRPGFEWVGASQNAIVRIIHLLKTAPAPMIDGQEEDFLVEGLAESGAD